MRIMISAVAIAMLAGTLQAGDWTGAYAGGQAGYYNGGARSSGDTVTYGLHGGYDIDFGDLVLGAELEFGRMNLSQGGGANGASDVGRIKFRAGRDFGSIMAYAIAGGVNARAPSGAPSGSATGTVYGLGLLTSVGENLTLSGEALRQVFGNFAKSGSDLKTDLFNVRVSFHF